MRRKIILDCDPGHDDAIAIMLAGINPQIELLGISVTSGNQTIEKTARNAFNVARYLDINCPIAVGNGFPIVREREICEAIHGESGLDGFTFPEYKYEYDSRDAVNFIIDLCLAHEKVTVVTTGPMTNLALALRVNPLIKEHIEEIIFMGGSTTNGNVTPAAEFNILCDPEAAYIVLKSGIPTKMVGLNVTRKVMVIPEAIERMDKINNKASKLFVDLMRVFSANQMKTFKSYGPLHDPVTIVSLIDNECVKYQDMNVEIDISHGTSYGRTNCDGYDYQKKEHNCQVAVDIDVNKFWDIIEDNIKRY